MNSSVRQTLRSSSDREDRAQEGPGTFSTLSLSSSTASVFVSPVLIQVDSSIGPGCGEDWAAQSKPGLSFCTPLSRRGGPALPWSAGRPDTWSSRSTWSTPARRASGAPRTKPSGPRARSDPGTICISGWGQKNIYNVNACLHFVFHIIYAYLGKKIWCP